MKLRTFARPCLILALGLVLGSPRAARAADVNGAWANLTITGSALANRGQHGAIDDPLADRMVVFGGAENLADTWSLSLGGPNSWTNLNPTNPPTGRKAMSVVYD